MSWTLMAASLLLGLASPVSASPAGYISYEIGDVAARTPARTEAALMLMGGGDWDYAAFRWFAEKAGHGHIVVLRASGDGDAGVEIYRDVGGVASVTTLVFDDRKAANDPRLLAILKHADGIFIAGGDQANYVRYWRGTPVQTALNDHVARGRPIGGTSAGLAILGAAAYGAMDGGSIDSATALADPSGPAVTIVRDFLRMPYLAHVVTDTHFTARDRLGRLIAFLARVRATSDPAAVGLGIDEKSSLCVDARGIGRVYTAGDGHAWLVRPRGVPKLVAGRPLDRWTVRVTAFGPEGRIDLRTMQVTRPSSIMTISVSEGRLSGFTALPTIEPTTAK